MNITNTMSTELIIKALKQGKSIDELAKIVALPSLKSYLKELLDKKHCTIDILADLSEMDRSTIYRAKQGTRKTSRNTLLRLAFALQISLEETQLLLKCGDCATLSGHRERDLYLIEGILKKHSIDEINDILIKKGFIGIYSKG